MKMLTKSNATTFAMALIFSAALFAMPAEAAGGLVGNADKVLDQVKTALVTLAVVVVTIAIIIAGYQIMFMHKRFTDTMPIVIGALFIGSASTIAAMLIPSGG